MKFFIRLSLFLLFVLLQTGCATFSDQDENESALAPVEDKSSSQNPYAAIKQRQTEELSERPLEQPAISSRDTNQPSLRFEEVPEETEFKTQEQNKEVPRAPAPHSLWIWPTSNPIIHEFDATGTDRRKGIDFSGKVGDSVRAVRAGKVVFAGAGLKGYGQLIIIKHDSNLLTAYAHNHSLLVKEGDLVDAGQVIAEMGLNEQTGTVMLHFEVRLNGKPVNPLGYLPQRG